MKAWRKKLGADLSLSLSFLARSTHRYPFDPLKAIREMHDWRGLGSGQSKGKQA